MNLLILRSSFYDFGSLFLSNVCQIKAETEVHLISGWFKDTERLRSDHSLNFCCFLHTLRQKRCRGINRFIFPPGSSWFLLNTASCSRCAPPQHACHMSFSCWSYVSASICLAAASLERASNMRTHQSAAGRTVTVGSNRKRIAANTQSVQSREKRQKRWATEINRNIRADGWRRLTATSNVSTLSCQVDEKNVDLTH